MRIPSTWSDGGMDALHSARPISTAQAKIFGESRFNGGPSGSVGKYRLWERDVKPPRGSGRTRDQKIAGLRERCVEEAGFIAMGPGHRCRQ